MPNRSVDALTFDHVQIAAPPGCEEHARAFYGELLGPQELRKPPALGADGHAVRWDDGLPGVARFSVGRPLRQPAGGPWPGDVLRRRGGGRIRTCEG